MDPLDPSALLETLPTLLPARPISESSAPGFTSWQLRNPQDGLAAMAHTIMTRLDFRLINLGESHRVTPSSPDSSTVANRLPNGWSRGSPDTFTFGYKHEQSSLEFIVKVIKMANRTLFNATAVEDSKTATYELQTSDYTSASFFPYPSSPSTGAQPEHLVNGFISSSRLRDFVLAYKQLIVQKLVPGLRKDGYEEGTSEAEGSGSRRLASGQSQQQQQLDQGERRHFYPDDPVGPRLPNRPPYFDDPDDPSTPDIGGRNPLIIGDRDLDPLGGAPFAGPHPFGGGSFGPPPLFPGQPPDHGGGMIVGPDHPMFRDRFQPGGFGGGGMAGLPPGAVPPGARFDPIGPFGQGPCAPQPGAGRGRRGPATGEPDFDDFRPPRSSDYDNMFM
ncbi:hypothetical protein K437DRAFT_259824 [Tilletiaria anomala UBC 951]|uniref:Uncharacterized protein n=1 Tax=Tilletiaria anomala (strain ATCC 24038 / CBS 436.72 / UBC 951) TaxID=1037660 RepID=A0A066V784_TILAU|nr:uncharacterized protein K437DRAFT_259824 [Tilletiaria anomala UBC 951]KDN37316.1 hypothetical protein K437DRAFT_259824 [Tilletiaria anomala UBC 951]